MRTNKSSQKEHNKEGITAMKCCGKTSPKSKSLPDLLKASDNETVCYCKKVSKGRIIKAIKKGAKDLDDIQRMTFANTGNKCKTMNPKGRCCAGDIKILLDLYKD
jgi:NAD(P)H-nitrite reductase large subunit